MNDPSLVYCEIRSSFAGPLLIPKLPWKKFQESKVKVGAMVEATDPVFPLFVNSQSYHALDQIKRSYDKYDGKTFRRARDIANPFEQIGNSVYGNRAAVKLANIDAVVNLTAEKFDSFSLFSDYPLVFADVASGPGGFTQYLQMRYPNSTGYGITLRGPLDFNENIVDMSRFTPFYGVQDTGDLYECTFEFEDFIQEQTEKRGLDLMLADGGIEADVDQEFLTSPLLTCQVYLGLTCLKAGGTFVLKVFDTVNEYSAQLVFLLAMAFEEILFFKPISSRPANSERYLICRNFLSLADSSRRLITKAVKIVTASRYLETLGIDLPKEFTEWLTEINNQAIDSQLRYNDLLINVLEKKKTTIPRYNLHVLSSIWNIP